MNINIENIKGNIFGGITAGVIALPLSLAFGVASGLGALAGLYGAIIVCLFAGLFGGTPTQISGPTGPMTVVVASIILTNPGNYKLIFMTIFIAGLLQIILGFSKVGEYIKYVPYPVISGFMSGIGFIILLLQMNQLLGLEYKGAPVLAILNVAQNFAQINPQSFALGVITLIIVFFTPKKISNQIPSSLIALVAVTGASLLLNCNVPVIGDIPRALPSIQIGLISLNEFKIILPMAITLALLGSIDSLLTSLVADSLTKTKHKSNQELIGQGIGNMMAGIFGGLAGAGATMRTVVNIKAGGRTKLSGVVHSIFLICIIAFFAPLAAKIPLAVLAGILIKVGIDIIDYKFLAILKTAPKGEIAVMVTVFLITVLDDLILAVGAGIVLSSILFAAKMARKVKVVITQENTEELFEEDKKNDTITVHLNGVLFFGSASLMLSRLEKIHSHENIILDCTKVNDMDLSAIFALEDMILRLKSCGTNMTLKLKNKRLGKKILAFGLIKVLEDNEIKLEYES